MPLSELNKELYNRESKAIADRTHEQSQYDPALSGAEPSPFEGEERWQQPQKGLTREQKKKLWIALAILFFVTLSVGGAIFYKWWQKNAFHEDRVSIYFEGPKEADSTQQTKYVIHYKNDNRVTLRNAEIQLNYSENFQPTDNVNLKFLSPTTSKVFVGDISSKSEGSVELKGIFYAPKDFPVYLHATLGYMPSNGTTSLAMENQIGVNITNSPVLLEVSAPQQAVAGDSVEYVIDYKNLDIRRLAEIQIRVEFPQGFKLSSAQPKPSEGESYWYVGNLEANQGGKIRIQGQIEGTESEGKNIIVSLGHVGEGGKFAIYNKRETSTRIVAPLLAVSQRLEGSGGEVVNAGDVLKYTISYQNTGTTGLRDAIITAEINGKILDFSKLNIEKGAYDSKQNIIVWKASDVPGLANINPKSGGEVHFSIPVKNVIPVSNKDDKNFVVTSLAKIDSPDIPTPIDSNKIIGSDKLELKLASKVIFETRGYYNDSKIKNSGPIPMQVGKETTFAIHWLITNVSNDVSDVKIVSSLPSGLRWTGSIAPSTEKISYNTRTNQIVWDVGIVEAGAGVLSAPREIVFQVGVTPQESQAGEFIKILNKSNLSAKDLFVSKEISLEGDEKNTQLSEDSSVGYEGGKVSKQ